MWQFQPTGIHCHQGAKLHVLWGEAAFPTSSPVAGSVSPPERKSCFSGIGCCSAVMERQIVRSQRLPPVRRAHTGSGDGSWQSPHVPLTLSWLSMGTTPELCHKAMTHLIAQLDLRRYKADVEEPCSWATQASSSHGTAGTTHGGSRFSRYFATSTQSSPFSALAVLRLSPASGPARQEVYDEFGVLL